jgi:hypothetical protein
MWFIHLQVLEILLLLFLLQCHVIFSLSLVVAEVVPVTEVEEVVEEL